MKSKNIFLYACIILFFIFWLFVFGADIQLSFEIKWLWIRHWTPNNINLWTIQYSNQLQDITWKFSDYFWVEDLMWLKTWHYTTIQCDWLYGPTWSIITWIYFKVENVVPTKIMWKTWEVYISDDLIDYKSIYEPLVYIYKINSVLNWWKANKYWDMPYVKVVIPPYTTPWTYNWTIIFSLYMN